MKRMIDMWLIVTTCILLGITPSFGAEPVVVTATRTAQTVDDTLAPVTVIQREDIERSGAQDLRELLRGTPGFDAISNGGYGQATSVFLRGTNSDHVLTLVDGVKLFSATLGATAFQFIPLNHIDRIEIVRGPRAALYGSEALGGVIHIFTRRGSKDTEVDIGVAGGSDSTKELDLGVSGSTGNSRYSIRAGVFDTDGFDVTEGNQLDDDGYDNKSINANWGFNISETTQLELGILHADGNVEYDNAFDPATADNESDISQQVLSSRLSLMPTETWTLKLNAGQSRDDSEIFKDGTSTSQFDTKRNEVSLQNDLVVSDLHLLTVGVDYSDDEVDGSVAYDVDTRNNIGVFAQWQGDYGQHNVVFGLRNDDNEQFGTKTTGSLDYGVDLNDSMRVNIGYGTAFKAPSFNQLYFPDFGNAGLQPEESKSFELGLTGSAQAARWGIRAFTTDIDELIVTNLNTFKPENIDEAEIRGIEAEYATRLAEWNLSGSLTFLSPEDAATGNLLRRRAKRTFHVSANRDVNAWRFAVSLTGVGSRFEDAANSIKLDSYEVVDTSISRALSSKMRLRLDVENLLDEDYQTASGFNQKGRSAMLRLAYQWY